MLSGVSRLRIDSRLGEAKYVESLYATSLLTQFGRGGP
ncbi:hypothetical protein P186_2382 [Pyrobaculum ferrireducens]|uniref:Uncharacterized protein n=2 Tax=Pyrobaculum ferrireducens TaxID=1104324 RepID=G7VC82_9CREN|nr:hypothetical protein P186_2382 [Pyrobaculum ferrireducens]